MEVVQQNSYTLVRYGKKHLDAAAVPLFRKIMSKKVGRTVREGQPVILDLQGVELIDDRGLGAILAVMYELQTKSKLLLCGAGKNLLALFKLARLEHVFKPYKDVAAALTVLQLT